MKSFFTTLCLLLMMNCASQKTTETTSNNNESKKNMSLNISYEARTRGRSKVLQVVNNIVTYKTNTKDKTVTLSSEAKKEIAEIVAKIDLENLKHLKAPTDKRIFDGAMHTTVRIKKDNKEYASSNFDDGHPPIELQPLVDLLMKTVE